MTTDASVLLDEEAAALDEIDMILLQSRPKHLLEGIQSGLGFIVSGAVGALGIMVLSPQVGASAGYDKTGGALGGVVGGTAGTVVGLATATSVAAGGVLSGISQILRGIATTPDAVVQPRTGKWWSPYEGRWVETHLKSDKEWLDEQPAYDEDILGKTVLPDSMKDEMERSKRERAAEFGVFETDLYDLLGVDPDADEEEIKRRFAQLGKMFSPTRAGADSEQTRRRYQQVSNACVILCNRELRKRYDKAGMKGVYGDHEEKPLVNPTQLFGILFGSEKFDDYFGRLAMASQAIVSNSMAAEMTAGRARMLQKRRVTRVALKLAERLKKWTTGDEEGAKQEWEAEAKALSDSNYGLPLVHLIGSVYSLCAAQFLGSIDSGIGMPSIRRWAKKQQVELEEAGKLTLERVSAFVVGNAKVDALKEEVNSTLELANTESERRSITGELYEIVGEDFLEILWTRTTVDVTSTIHEASQMVLFDLDLNDETRKKRGQGLELLGRIFQDATHEPSEEIVSQQAAFEKVAFYAIVDIVRNHEIATRNAPRI